MRDVYTLHTPPHYTYTKPLFDTWTPPSEQDEREHHLTIAQGSDADSDSASDEPSVPAAVSTPVASSTPLNSKDPLHLSKQQICLQVMIVHAQSRVRSPLYRNSCLGRNPRSHLFHRYRALVFNRHRRSQAHPDRFHQLIQDM